MSFFLPAFLYIAASSVYHLWEFIRDLLKDPKFCPKIIKWENKPEGIFRVVQSNEVAKLWGSKKKNRSKMTYEKLSRSLRYLFIFLDYYVLLTTQLNIIIPFCWCLYKDDKFIMNSQIEIHEFYVCLLFCCSLLFFLFKILVIYHFAILFF